MSFWSGFAGGMGSGMQQGANMGNMLKGRMTQPQQPATPFPAPGQDVPYVNELGTPMGPQQPQQNMMLQQLLRMFGG